MINDKIRVALYRYMLAHIRLNSRCVADNLGESEVQDMFATMDPPKIDFNEWCESLGLDLKSEEEINEEVIEAMKVDSVAQVGPKIKDE